MEKAKARYPWAKAWIQVRGGIWCFESEQEARLCLDIVASRLPRIWTAEPWTVSAMTIGSCKLTGTKGKFVKSHLLPQALTKPSLAGQPFIEAGLGRRPVRRYTSWYDKELVTREGEDILENYDSWGISELRRLKLIWSSWGPMLSLATGDLTRLPVIGPTGHGIRRLACRDPAKFRLFFLSLLWRAAATSRPEFDAVQLPEGDLRSLSAMVREGNPAPLDFYPATLVQIASQGPVHNFGPLTEDSDIDVGEDRPWRRHIFRFYTDYGAISVGFGLELAVQTKPAIGSLQHTNLAKQRGEARLQWPKAMRRLGDR